MSKEIHAELLFKMTAQLERVKAKEEELICHLHNLEEKLQCIENRKKIRQQELIDLER
mgnify:CR=1 FL=1